ncbi:hypothetical protein D3C71_2049070 [compost metagenome]
MDDGLARGIGRIRIPDQRQHLADALDLLLQLLAKCTFVDATGEVGVIVRLVAAGLSQYASAHRVPWTYVAAAINQATPEPEARAGCQAIHLVP